MCHGKKLVKLGRLQLVREISRSGVTCLVWVHSYFTLSQ